MSSVVKSKRGETKFDLILKARDLCVYTIRITSNENVFIKDFQKPITDDIVRCSKDIFINLFEANNIDIRPTSIDLDENVKLRRTLINNSIRECYNLLALMQIAKPLFHLSSKRIKYWAGLTIEVRDKARKLRDSDRNRTANKL